MRTRSDRKRQAILDAAYDLFREKGFEKTSVSEIRARAGGSRATIYSYFSSKEELFVECMFSLVEHYLEGAFSDLQSAGDNPHRVLARFGKNFVRLVCSPEMVSIRRQMIVDAERAGIGPLFYDKLLSIRRLVTSFLSRSMLQGQLRVADADLAAGQLRALLEAELFEAQLLCARHQPPDETSIGRAADRAIETFMRAYARELR